MDDNDVVWIELETNKGGDSISCYRGNIRRYDFERIIGNDNDIGFIKVSSVYWTDYMWDEVSNVRREVVTRLGGSGKYECFSGVVYLRAEHIVSLYLIDGYEDMNRITGLEEV